MLSLKGNIQADLLGDDDVESKIDTIRGPAGDVPHSYQPPDTMNPIFSSVSFAVKEANTDSTGDLCEVVPSPPVAMKKMTSDPVTYSEKIIAQAVVGSEDPPRSDETAFVANVAASLAEQEQKLSNSDFGPFKTVPGGGGRLNRSASDEAKSQISLRPDTRSYIESRRYRGQIGMNAGRLSPHRHANSRPTSNPMHNGLSGGLFDWLGLKANVPDQSELGASGAQADVESGSNMMESILQPRDVIETFFCRFGRKI